MPEAATKLRIHTDGPWTRRFGTADGRERPMGASGRVARDPSECGGAPSRLSATRCRAPSRDSPSRPARDPSARQRRRDAAPPTAPRPLLQARLRDRFWAHAGQIEAQSGAARQARGQEAQGAPSRRGAGARDQAPPLRLAGASRRRRAAALGARPRALRAPARLLRERVRTLAVPTIVASGTLFSVAVCKSV